MQRNKIKVGAEYAVSTFRDWRKYSLKFVQVLDSDQWYTVSKWDEVTRNSDPETVYEPHRPAQFRLEVPSHIRRLGDRSYRTAGTSLVLVRYVTTDETGGRVYSEPTLVPTRSLVAERAAAEEQIAARKARLDEQSHQADAEKAQRVARMKSINERMTALGLPAIVTGWSSAANPSVPPSTLEALLTLAERSFEGTREFDPEF